MTKRRDAMKLERQRRRARQKLVQYITIGIVILIVAAIAWAVVASSQKASTTANTGNPAPTVAVMHFSSPPPMAIDTSKQYFATVKMAKGGEFVIQLFPDKAPVTVNSFVFLAEKGFFNGVTFHRVLDGFMAQGGDPTGTGTGGPGYSFINEANDLLFDKAGVVAYSPSWRN